MSNTVEVGLIINEGFSRYPYVEHLQRKANGDISSRQSPIGHFEYIENDPENIWQNKSLDATLTVHARRQPEITSLHQTSDDSLLYTLSPEVFQKALTISVREGDNPSESKTVPFPIRANETPENTGVIDRYDPLMYKTSLYPVSNSTRSNFMTIYELGERIKKLPLYSAVGKLIENQAGANIKVDLTSNNPFLACRQGFGWSKEGHKLLLTTANKHETISDFLESIFNKTSQAYPTKDNPLQHTIDLDTMIFAVKSESKGWEFYHCKSGDDFNILADKLRQRYQQEHVSIELVTSIHAEKEDFSDNSQPQYGLDRLFTTDGKDDKRPPHKNIEEFITAVQTNQARHNVTIYFNKDGSSVKHYITLVPAASA